MKKEIGQLKICFAVKVFLVATLVLFVCFTPTMASAPDMGDIPLYKGAIRNRVAEEEILEYAWGPENQRSYEVRVYEVEALIDDVCRFYIDTLGATEDLPDGIEYDEPYPAWYDLSFYNESIFKNRYEHSDLIHDGAWTKAAFEKRPQWKQGKWLSDVWFEWREELENGDLATYLIGVIDLGYDSRRKVDFRSTQIRFDITVTASADNWDDEQDWKMDRDIDEIIRNFAQNPPTEAELGIPFYPGWVFGAEISAGMSLGDYHYFVFFSADSMEQVAAFYRKHLGREPAIFGDSYLFALKGNHPLPEEGLSIELNRSFVEYPGTVITIQKHVED